MNYNDLYEDPKGRRSLERGTLGELPTNKIPKENNNEDSNNFGSDYQEN